MRQFAQALLLAILTLTPFLSHSAWEVKKLIQSNQNTLTLTGSGSKLEIPTDQLKRINLIFQRMCARAEQSGSFDQTGTTPNASARGLGNNRITVNFAKFAD